MYLCDPLPVLHFELQAFESVVCLVGFPVLPLHHGEQVEVELLGVLLLFPGKLVVAFPDHVLENHRFDPVLAGGVVQVWSLTQFYSVDFSKSRIDVKKCLFNKRKVKVCVSCCRRSNVVVETEKN